MNRRALVPAVLLALPVALSGGGTAAAAVVVDPVRVPGTETLSLSPLSSYETGIFDSAAAEIVAFDAGSRQLYVVSAGQSRVDVLDASDPRELTLLRALDPTGIVATDGSTVPAGTTPNSVDVRADGTVAVALEAPVKTDPGWVALFDVEGGPLDALRVGSLPDMLTFTEDGQGLVVANEAEPADDFTSDPAGSVSVVDLSGPFAALTQAAVRTAGFDAYDVPGALPEGVRVFGPDVPAPAGQGTPGRVARNLEPEYVVLDGDDRALVTLQEGNAFAVVDLTTATVTELLPLGTVDHRLPGNELDVSDRDGGPAPASWPITGTRMPDAAASFTSGGETYVVTANEGDAREWGDYVEPVRAGDLTLCPDAFTDVVGPGQEFATLADLQADEALGRLNVTSADGLRGGADCYEELVSFGTRSISVFDADGGLVFDSGSALEEIASLAGPDLFNSNHVSASPDNRSDDKGPEPEGVTVGELGGRTYAFVALERVGGIAVFDVTVPAETAFVTYVNNRDVTAYEGDEPTAEELSAAGDLGPEGLAFIAAEDSPLPGVPLLAVANEVSGTTTLLRVDVPPYDRGLALACPGVYTPGFVDVAGSVHELAIGCAEAAGITNGTADPTRYAPGGTVSRGQVASFVARLLEAVNGAPLPPAGDAFPDDTDSVHEVRIDQLAQLGIVDGRLDGTYGPDDPITRGQLAKVLAAALDSLDPSLAPDTVLDAFSDDDESPFAAQIDRLAAVGVVAGKGDGTYGPGERLTRGQVASVLTRALDLVVSRGQAEPVA